jgi:hypothetical protein
MPRKVNKDDGHENIQPESNLKHLMREIIHLLQTPAMNTIKNTYVF